MGRTALFLVMGLGMAMGYIGFQIYRSGQMASDTQYAYLKYVNARNLARTAVHAALRTYDRNQTPSTEVETSYADGSFHLDSLVASPSGDTLRIVAVGSYAESTYTMRLTLQRDTKPFPGITGAVGIRASPINFSMSGNPKINGSDHDIDGNLISGAPEMPGVAVMTGTDSSTVAAYSSDLTGTPKVKVDTTTADPRPYINEYLENADYRYKQENSPINETVWGSETNPVIVTCKADAGMEIKISGNAEGWGILVVQGGLNLTGTFRWHGLVIATGDSTVINVTASSGTPDIIGALIMAGGPNSSFSMKGTANYKFSSDALQKAKNIGVLRYYSILDWYE